MTADSGVGSVVIVVVEPGRVFGRAGFVAEVGRCVSPFRGEGPVETFDFPVGLGPVGSGPNVFDVTERGGEVSGSVAGPVVGHHGGHGDAGNWLARSQKLAAVSFFSSLRISE